MYKNKKVTILEEIIRLAKVGFTQAAIASRIGVKPSKIYQICKRYGIKTRYMTHRDKNLKTKNKRHYQYLLPL